MRTVSFTILGKPVPKGRPRFNTKTGKPYTPKKTREYEDLVGVVACGKKKFTGPVRIHLRFNTKSKADLDNLIKSVLDGLQLGGLFKNDSQVRAINAFYGVSDVEGVDVTVEDIDG